MLRRTLAIELAQLAISFCITSLIENEAETGHGRPFGHAQLWQTNFCVVAPKWPLLLSCGTYISSEVPVGPPIDSETRSVFAPYLVFSCPRKWYQACL